MNLCQTVKVLQTEELITTATAEMMSQDLGWLKCLVDLPSEGDEAEGAELG